MLDKAIGPQSAAPSNRVCGTCRGRKTVEVTSHKNGADGPTETKPVTCPACRGTGQGTGLMTK